MSTAKKVTSVLVIIVAIVAAWFGIRYTYSQFATPFNYIKFKGAKKTKSPNAGDRYDYPNSGVNSFGFYSNDRAVLIGSNPAKKGTYNKQVIRWDDGTVTQLSDVFKK